ncbi:MAG: hypothetical protein NVSMB60_04880 [Mycobacterium sp.]
MRFVATVFLWLVTTVALATAVPTMWAQKNIVDESGYATLAQSAATDAKLQQAMAGLLTDEVTSRYDIDKDRVLGVASAYTASTAFPGQFADVNRIAHRWMFTGAGTRDAQGRWVVDIAPMLSDTSLKQTLAIYNVKVPDNLTVPVTASAALRPGQLRPVATWGPGVSVGAAVITGVFALLTLAAARARGKAFAALGVSALTVGGAGWAGLEVARRYIARALDRTTGDVHQVADAMVDHAEAGLHQWLNLTLAAGGALAVFGVLVSMLGGLRSRD